MQLAAVLRAVVAQILLPGIKGGRVAAREILVNTPAVANLIRENKVAQIDSVIQTGAKDGMVTLANAIQELIKNGLVDKEAAKQRIEEKTKKRYAVIQPRYV